MKPLIQLLLSIAFTCLLLASMGCSDDDSELPAPTQEGLNTFGCLVNGEIWSPKGNVGYSNLDISYDPNLEGGSFDLATYRIINNEDQDYIYMYSPNVQNVGSYSLSIEEGVVTFDNLPLCNYDRDTSVYRTGILNITRLDLEQAIISGTFEFTLAKPNCDTIRVTKGRFDMKI